MPRSHPLTPILFVILSASAACPAAAAGPPDRSVREEVRRELLAAKGKDMASRGKTLNRIVDCGAAAVGPLVEVLEAGGLELDRIAAIGALGMIINRSPETREDALPVLIGLLQDSDAEVRRSAALSLSRAGHDARAAFPFVMEVVKREPDNPQTRFMTSQYLAALAPYSLDQLGLMLRNPDLDTRWQAAVTLGWLAAAARPAIPSLTKAISDEHPAMRVAACGALAMIGLKESDSAAIKAIIAAFQQKEPSWARERVAMALSKIGAPAKEAVPVLKEAMDDPDEGVRRGASAALERIAPGQPR